MKKLYILIVVLLFISSGFAQTQEKTESKDNQVTTNKDIGSIQTDQNYFMLSTKKAETMDKELNEVTKKGFRVLYGSASSQNTEMGILMERLSGMTEPYSYKVLATVKLKTMEKELNELASQGYRILPRCMMYKTGFLLTELLTIMEKAPNSNVGYQYKLVVGVTEKQVHNKINEAKLEKYVPVTMITFGGHILIMEKEIELKRSNQ
jgi:hypothetical protein